MGVTGGLAGALRRKWPLAFGPYSQVCRDAVALGRVTTCGLLGCFCISRASDEHEKLWILHVFGQIDPGPNTDLFAVEDALVTFSSELNRFAHPWTGSKLYAPHMMGCGLGGGHWPDYSAILETHIPDCIVVKLPKRSAKRQQTLASRGKYPRLMSAETTFNER